MFTIVPPFLTISCTKIIKCSTEITILILILVNHDPNGIYDGN